MLQRLHPNYELMGRASYLAGIVYPKNNMELGTDMYAGGRGKIGPTYEQSAINWGASAQMLFISDSMRRISCLLFQRAFLHQKTGNLCQFRTTPLLF